MEAPGKKIEFASTESGAPQEGCASLLPGVTLEGMAAKIRVVGSNSRSINIEGLENFKSSFGKPQRHPPWAGKPLDHSKGAPPGPIGFNLPAKLLEVQVEAGSVH